jgi:translation initiation factor 2B subunit (eIF-2B alpha/beta/delta family)
MDADEGATGVVTVFLRNRAEVLLLCRSDAVGSSPGEWGGVAGHVEREAHRASDGASGERSEPRGGAPDAAAREEIREETGVDPDACEPVRAGDPFPVEDPDHGTWRVHPYLFDCPTREVTTGYETADHEWVAPTEILRRETVPDLWTSYDRVRPTPETVAADAEHGSAYLSVRALEVLRDEAALADERGESWDDVAAVARDLLAARPSMRAVTNRVNRAMATADRTPASVEAAATSVVEDALDADERAAAAAAALLDGGAAVLTLSRSGTVAPALDRADTRRVYVAESRPGCEGVGVAEDLADATEVTLLPDAAVAHAVAAAPVDAVLVGADAVLPDGRVVNKVGTRAAALAAAREGVPCYAVAARDKVAHDEGHDLQLRDPAEVYHGDADLDVRNPTFDVAPADLVTTVTERGSMDADATAAVAEEHARNARWDEDESGTEAGADDASDEVTPGSE